jgi:Galactose oxidase, central domain
MRSLTVILGCLTVAATCPAQTPNWTQIKPTAWPAARPHYAIVYDSARQRTVLYGGVVYGGSPHVSAETWEWDGRNWTQIKPILSPSARQLHAMAYDSARQRTVLFGGAGTGRFGDTWEWDGRNWIQIKPTNSPSARFASAMAYDSSRQRTVLFGGMSARGYLGDTWEWDGKNWIQMKPTSSPPARMFHAVAYDSARRRTVLFGGYDNNELADTWEWDGRNWTQMKPASSPGKRWFHAMAYDSARQRTVLFGGLNAARDTWEWGGRNWIRMRPKSSPGARRAHAMAYDSARQRTVLFGHVDRRFALDTWEYGAAKLTLTASTSTISIANGGSQVLSVNAGADLKNKLYWIFGSSTSTMPGVVLTGIHIPLNPDLYTAVALVVPNSKELRNFKGTLDAKGLATATLTVPANLPFLPGFKLYHAYVVYDGTTGQIFTSSNPVSVEFK